jgi:ABC-type transport system involved in cytochrome c biogenesis permease subunit
MSVVWLRTAAALYSCGLLYALVYLFTSSTRLFRPALIAFAIATVFDFVSIVEFRVTTGHFPLSNFYETSTLCAFLIAIGFLLVYSFYSVSVFSVCLFPVVFVMTLVGVTEFPVGDWRNQVIRNTWLAIHVGSVLIGYAALILAAVASMYYLLKERQLKTKQITAGAKLPSLAILDRLITQSLNVGFVFITVGTVTGVVWASMETGIRWIHDPKIGFFLFTWAFYLAMIFLRVSAGWRGRRMAWLALSVLVCSLLTWVTHWGLTETVGQ